jgi:hypothetical protein
MDKRTPLSAQEKMLYEYVGHTPGCTHEMLLGEFGHLFKEGATRPTQRISDIMVRVVSKGWATKDKVTGVYAPAGITAIEPSVFD